MSANPISAPSEWQIFRINGISLPGIATVSGCVSASKLDVRNGTGTSGATVVYQGDEPKAFTVELHLLEPDDYDAWLTGPGRTVLLTPPTGKNPKSFSVDHPACQECGITSCIKAEVGQGERQDDLSYKVKISLQPTPPPKPASGTPKGSPTQGGSNDAPSAADALIKSLGDQITKLTS